MREKSTISCDYKFLSVLATGRSSRLNSYYRTLSAITHRGEISAD